MNYYKVVSDKKGKGHGIGNRTTRIRARRKMLVEVPR